MPLSNRNECLKSPTTSAPYFQDSIKQSNHVGKTRWRGGDVCVTWRVQAKFWCYLHCCMADQIRHITQPSAYQRVPLRHLIGLKTLLTVHLFPLWHMIVKNFRLNAIFENSKALPDSHLIPRCLKRQWWRLNQAMGGLIRCRADAGLGHFLQ